jgi:hypothetical protein
MSFRSAPIAQPSGPRCDRHAFLCLPVRCEAAPSGRTPPHRAPLIHVAANFFLPSGRGGKKMPEMILIVSLSR